MNKEEKEEYKQLEEERDKIYEFFEFLVKNFDTQTTSKFWNKLAELIDVEIKMESFCNE